MEIIEAAEKILKKIEDSYSSINHIARAGLFRAYLDVLARMIFNKNYTSIPEYKKILSTLQQNYKFSIKSEVFTRNEKIKLIAIKINIRLYKLLQAINNLKKDRILFK